MRSNKTTERTASHPGHATRRQRACVPYQRGEVRPMLRMAAALHNETSILILFNMTTLQKSVPVEPDLGIDPARDMIMYSVIVNAGVIDIIVVHADGTATAVVVCNGDRGGAALATALLSCKPLAAALKAAMPTVSSVRPAMLWTSTGDLFIDTLFDGSCRRMGIVPVMWGTMGDSLAAVAPLAPPHRAGRRAAA